MISIADFFKILYLPIVRSSLFTEKVRSTLVGGTIFLFLGIELFSLGYFACDILSETFTDSLPINTFSRYFLFLFAFDICMKVFIKSPKSANITPYLTLPIKQKKLFLLSFVKEVFSVWNFYLLILIVPFLCRTFLPMNSLAKTLVFILGFYVASLTLSIMVRHIKIAAQQSTSIIVLQILLLFGFIGIAYFISQSEKLIIDLNHVFSEHSLVSLAVIIGLFVGVVWIFLKLSKRELYANTNTQSVKKNFLINWQFLDNIGEMSQFIKLNFIQIFRSKLKINFVLLPLIFIPNIISSQQNGHNFQSSFFLLLIIGMVGLMLGEMTFAFESTFFDKLMTLPKEIPIKILKGRYLFISFFALLIASLLGCFLPGISFWLIASMLLYVIGPMYFCILQNAVYCKKRVDILAKPHRFQGFEGFSVYAFLNVIAYIILIVTVGIISKIISEKAAIIYMVVTGITFTATSPIWIRNIYNRFLKRKYQNMEAFRND